MTMRTFLTAVVVLLFPSVLLAQTPGSTKRPAAADRLQSIQQQLDDAMKAAADVPAALKSLESVQHEVMVLRQEIDRLKGNVRGNQALPARLDNLDSRLSDLELKLTALALQLSQTQGGGYDDSGFFVRSADRRFLMRFGLLTQVAYTGRVPGLSDRAGSVDDLYPKNDQFGKASSDFELRRAKFVAAGHLYDPRFTYKFEIDFGAAEKGPLLEAYGNVYLWPHLQLQAGRFKVPYSRQNLYSSSRQLFTERSEATRSFAPGRDVGAMLHGTFLPDKQVAYQVGVFNGGNQLDNNNVDLLYAARLVVAPLGQLSDGEVDFELSPFRVAVGASFFYDLMPTDLPKRLGVSNEARSQVLSDVDKDKNIDNLSATSWAAELVARYKGVTLQSEWFFKRIDDGAAPLAAKTYIGTYQQLGAYCPAIRTALAARYAFWEPFGYNADRKIGFAERVQEVQALASLFWWEHHLVAQLEYGHQWLREIGVVENELKRTGAPVNLHQIRVQIQLSF